MGFALRQYAMPALAALLLHGLLVVWLQGAWNPDRSTSRIIKPQIVHSTLLVLEPKPKPRPAPAKPAQRKPEPIEPAPAVVKPQVKETPRPDPAIEAAREAAFEDRRRAEQEQLQAEERARAQRLQALADSSFLHSLEDESTNLAENATADAEEAAQSYRYGISQLIVANWSRPPSARNGMEARLQVELVPTGDVVAVMLLQSSGSTAFDQSAEAAVRKARRFIVPPESAIFEKYFRRFTLLFKPEDLLR